MEKAFSVLSLGLRCNIPLAQDVIVTTAILHNIARRRNERHVDIGDIEYDIDIGENINNENGNDRVRRELIEYFSTL